MSPVHSEVFDVQLSPVHGVLDETQSSPVHGVFPETQLSPVHGVSLGLQSLPVHGVSFSPGSGVGFGLSVLSPFTSELQLSPQSISKTLDCFLSSF